MAHFQSSKNRPKGKQGKRRDKRGPQELSDLRYRLGKLGNYDQLDNAGRKEYDRLKEKIENLEKRGGSKSKSTVDDIFFDIMYIEDMSNVAPLVFNKNAHEEFLR